MNIQEEKAQVIKDINGILKSLYTYFPWVVVEIIYSMQERFGMDEPLLKGAKDGVLDEVCQDILDEYVPECFPEEESVADITASIYEVFKKNYISDALNRPAFTLELETQDACKPWDIAEKEMFNQTDINLSGLSPKVNVIQNVKASLGELNCKKSSFETQADDFKIEIEAINIMNDVLDTSK